MPDPDSQPPPERREYQQMMRGPRFAWWRPLVALTLALAFSLLLMLVVALACFVAGLGPALDVAMEQEQMTPVAFGAMNLWLASLIPASMWATRIAYGVSAGYLSSVAGRFRWRWLLRCLVTTLPLYVVCVGLLLLFDTPEEPRPEQWALLLLLVLTTTPLQAAGEEYVARGVLLQGVGAWFRRPGVSLVVASVLSLALFAMAHGSADPWIVLDMSIFAAACCILVWRTGGLEAAVALHAVNNVVGMTGSLIVGGWNEGFVSATSQGEFHEPLVTLVVSVAVVALVLRQAVRLGVQRSSQ